MLTLIAFIVIVVLVGIVILQYKGVLPSRLPLKRVDDHGLYFRRGTIERTFSWDQVKTLYPAWDDHGDMRSFNRFEIELSGGRHFVFVILPGKVHATLNQICDYYLDYLTQSIGERSEELSFAHPTRWITQKRKAIKLFTIATGIALPALALLGNSMGGAKGAWLLPVPGLLLVVFPIAREGFYIRNCRFIANLTLSDRHVSWTDRSGQSRTKRLAEVQSHRLEKTKGMLLPWPISTSACRNLATICGPLCFFMSLTLSEIASNHKDPDLLPGNWSRQNGEIVIFVNPYRTNG